MSRFAVFGKDVTLILEVDERPILAVPSQDNAASFTSVSTVRSTEFDEFSRRKWLEPDPPLPERPKILT